MSAEIAVSESAVQSIQSHGITWFDVERPTKRDCARLAEVHQLLTRDSETFLDRSRLSSFTRRDGYDLLVLQVPIVATSRRRANPSISPVSIVIGPDYALTIHYGDVRPLIRFFRELETDDRARGETFGRGVPTLILAIVQRLIDATIGSRGYLERAITAQEELINHNDGGNNLTGTALRLRKEVQRLRRITIPAVSVLRELRQSRPVDELDQDWEMLTARLDALLTSLDDDLSALDGVLLAASAAAQLRMSRYLRALLALSVLALPVLVVTTTLGMTVNSPLTGQPYGFTIGLAIAGVVFLVALFMARHSRLI